MTSNAVIALILHFLSPNSTHFQADYITVVEGRLIMSVKYCFPVPVFHFWRKLLGLRTLQRGLSAIAKHLVSICLQLVSSRQYSHLSRHVAIKPPKTGSFEASCFNGGNSQIHCVPTMRCRTLCKVLTNFENSFNVVLETPMNYRQNTYNIFSLSPKNLAVLLCET